MYGFFRFVEKLNIRNDKNRTRNCVHYMYRMFGFAEKLNIHNRINLKENCVHNMYRLSGFEKKIEYPEMQKLSEIICTKCLDLQKN